LFYVFFYNKVGIGTPGTEGTDGRTPGIMGIPFRKLMLDIKRRIIEIDIGIQCFGMERGNQLIMFQLKKNFGNARNAGCCFQVSDIGFDRADGTILLL